MTRPAGAELQLRAALEADPEFAPAAYNLCVLLAEDRIDEALAWCRRADALEPQDPRNPYTLAFYQHYAGKREQAARTLRRLIERHPAYVDAYVLLGSIREEQADTAAAIALFRQALASGALADGDRALIQERLRALGER